MSGPIAVVAAGLAWCHAPDRLRGRSHVNEQVTLSWGAIDDVLNIDLFLLMGLQLLAVAPGLGGVGVLPLVFLLAVSARAVSVGIPLAASRMTGRDKLRGVAVLTWTGMRGGISVALALTLPPGPFQKQLLVIAYAVVMMTIVIQGLTVPFALRALYRSAQPPAPH